MLTGGAHRIRRAGATIRDDGRRDARRRRADGGKCRASIGGGPRQVNDLRLPSARRLSRRAVIRRWRGIVGGVTKALHRSGAVAAADGRARAMHEKPALGEVSFIAAIIAT